MQWDICLKNVTFFIYKSYDENKTLSHYDVITRVMMSSHVNKEDLSNVPKTEYCLVSKLCTLIDNMFLLEL